jgi:hypothetical protein
MAHGCLIYFLPMIASFFSEASNMGAARISNILDTYNKGSSQLVNKQKSVVFFSGNTIQEEK